ATDVAVTPGATAVVAFTVTNNGTVSETFELDIESGSFAWTAYLSSDGGPIEDAFTLKSGESVEFEARALIPIDSVDGQTDLLTLAVRSTGSDEVTDEAEVDVIVQAPRLVATLVALTDAGDPRPNDEITYRL